LAIGDCSGLLGFDLSLFLVDKLFCQYQAKVASVLVGHIPSWGEVAQFFDEPIF